MSFLDRIRECNEHDLSGFRPFVVAGHRVGWARDDVAARLAAYPGLFDVRSEAVVLDRGLDSFEARSAAVEPVLEELGRAGVIPGWRGEPYPVLSEFGAPPLMRMERAAIPWLGVRAYGVHVNGYVARGGAIRMWVARRSRHKPTFPGMLDNMVAGGQPIGLSLMENLIKESEEEAGISPALARRAVPVGAVSYCKAVPEGLKPDVQFCYDLELPGDFVPRPIDGEIESFHLWPIDRVMAVVSQTREFKFNCNLVIIDFLVRRGLIAPEDPDYLDIVRELRR